MDELPFKLNNWTYKDLMEEIEDAYVPSDQGSIVDEDDEESEFLNVPDAENILLSDDSDVPDDSAAIDEDDRQF